ncbi:hypothetical protein [Acinetobacter puyangensis]|uniref:hypothetical protein n=1 Tax=Acinetobacter puyangensis TaxID=1096779 RepID=UPI003A4DF34F
MTDIIEQVGGYEIAKKILVSMVLRQPKAIKFTQHYEARNLVQFFSKGQSTAGFPADRVFNISELVEAVNRHEN